MASYFMQYTDLLYYSQTSVEEDGVKENLQIIKNPVKCKSDSCTDVFVYDVLVCTTTVRIGSGASNSVCLLGTFSGSFENWQSYRF